MKALLLIAHGSRRTDSNQSIELLTKEIQRVTPGSYDYYRHAFLEFANPSIENALNDLVKMNVKEISVFPYFLSPGNHVLKDIPAILALFIQNHPEIKLTLLPYFGDSPKLPELIANICTGSNQ